MTTMKPSPSCFVAATPESLAEVIVALGLKRRGEWLFKGSQQVANIYEGRYIFFLMNSDHYARLVEAAKKNANLSAF